MPRWLHSLGPKTLAILFAVAAVNTALSYFVLQSVVQPAFDSIETGEAAHEIERIRVALGKEQGHLVATSADWAVWDDSYAFVQGRNAAYLDDNILPSVFQNLNLSLIAFQDRECGVLFSYAADPASGERLPSEAFDVDALLAALPQGAPAGAADVAAGLVDLHGRLLLVVRHPVVDTLAAQPPAGALVMARPVDARLIALLRDQTGADFRLLPLPGADASALTEAAQALIDGRAGTDAVVVSARDGVLVAESLLAGIGGQPVALMKAQRARTISAAGGESVGLAILLMALSAVAQLAVAWFLLGRMVLRPIHRLTRHIKSANDGRETEPPAPLRWQRGDELGMLADTYDRLNAALALQVRDLNHALARLHAADAAKSAFFANMSHELRTPLNAIIGFSDLLATQPFGPIPDKRYLDYIGDIHSSGHHLLDLVNEILDYSKADSQQLQLVRERFSIHDIVDDAMRMIRLQAGQSGVALHRDLPADLPPLLSDKLRLSQILLNLLSNAVKFTDSGDRVTVSACAQGDHVQLEVADTGIGIAPEDIPRALAPFVQLPQRQRPAAVSAAGGTGLGLPLAKRLTELLEGRFELTSEPGKGTTVRLFLPLVLSDDALSGRAQLRVAS